jgi:predicted MPP superfamily phosphohydrolase
VEPLIFPATPQPTLRLLLSRRNFLRGLVGAISGGAAGAAYMRWAEPDWFEVTHTAVTLPRRSAEGGHEPLRVLHLSDLHAYAPWVSLVHIAESVKRGLAQKPDLICLTGDFITLRYDAFAEYVNVLRPLAAVAPTFACLGNHDGGNWARGDGGYGHAENVRELLKASGIELLHNTTRELTARGRRVQLIGVGDWWAGECKPAVAFSSAPPRNGAVRLVLNHNPDAKSAMAAHDWDLMLCGHTHGGQIGIPALARRFAPVADKRFIAGLYPWEGRQLFITRGVGNLHHARLFCRPEVSLLLVA